MEVYHEIAIDPDSIQNYRDLQVIGQSFGYHQGRLISAFPKKGPSRALRNENWAASVMKNINTHEPDKAIKSRALLENKISNLIFKSNGRIFNHALQWLDAARESHQEAPFSVIISENGDRARLEYPLDLLGDEQEAETPDALRNNLNTMSVTKDFRKLAEKLRPLLWSSNKLILVDQYFDPAKPKWQIPLQEIVNVIAQGPRKETVKVEYHFAEKEFTDVARLLKSCEKECEYRINRNLKNGVLFVVHDKEYQAFHARYLLSEIAGIGLEYGLDQNDKSKSDLYRWDKEQSLKKIKEYRESETEEPMGSLQVMGKR